MLRYSKFPLFSLLALLCATVSGCTSTKYISSNPAASEELARSSENNEVTIRFLDGRIEYQAYHVSLRADSTEWYSADRARRRAAPTSEIESISIQSSDVLGGMLTGFEIGLAPSFLGGLIGGYGLVYAKGTFNEAGFAEGFGIVMAPFVMIGGLAAIDHRTEYKP
jgi:hypothetical protein